MKELSKIVSKYIEEYRLKREKLKKFLEEREISFIKSFDVKNNTVFLICDNVYEKHILELKKNDLIKDFRENFGTSNLSIIIGEKNE